MSSAEPRAALKPLTSLRFLAALAVFCSHLDFFKGHQHLKWIYDRFFYEGYLGVSFFFVLSGFILTYNYHGSLAGLDARGMKRFYLARFARIYPVHFLTFLVSLPLLYHALFRAPAESLLTAISNLLLAQSFFADERFYYSFNMPSWSLSDEFFFYALLPFVLALLLKRRRRSTAFLLGLAVGVWGVTLLLVSGLRDLPASHWLFYIAPPFRLADFLLGVLAGLVFVNRPHLNLNDKLWTGLEAATPVILLGMVYGAWHVKPAYRYGVYYSPFFTLAIFLFAFQKGLVSRVLSRDFFLLLGEVSFSFYMFHQLVLRYLYAASHRRLGYEQSPLATAVVALLVAAGLSYLCYEYFEKPMRERFRRAA